MTGLRIRARRGLTRRRVMRLIAMLLASASMPRTGSAAEREHVAGLFADPDAAAAIGRAYLRGQAVRPSLASLRAAVMEALCGDPAPMQGEAARRARFHACIQEDFAAARVVMVDGWVLSRIEAQACAIVSLTAERSS